MLGYETEGSANTKYDQRYGQSGLPITAIEEDYKPNLIPPTAPNPRPDSPDLSLKSMAIQAEIGLTPRGAPCSGTYQTLVTLYVRSPAAGFSFLYL